MKLAPERILSAVIEETNATRGELMSDSRISRLVLARMVYFAAAKLWTSAGEVEIGELIGKVHSSVNRAVAKFYQRDDAVSWLGRVERRLKGVRSSDVDLEWRVQQLEQALAGVMRQIGATK